MNLSWRARILLHLLWCCTCGVAVLYALAFGGPVSAAFTATCLCACAIMLGHALARGSRDR